MRSRCLELLNNPCLSQDLPFLQMRGQKMLLMATLLSWMVYLQASPSQLHLLVYKPIFPLAIRKSLVSQLVKTHLNLKRMLLMLELQLQSWPTLSPVLQPTTWRSGAAWTSSSSWPCPLWRELQTTPDVYPLPYQRWLSILWTDSPLSPSHGCPPGPA